MAKKILTYQLRIDEESGLPYKGFLREEEDSLENWYKIIDTDTIQIIHLTDEIDCIVDDNGKIFNKMANRLWLYDDKVVDVIVGNIICTRHVADELSSIEQSDIPIILAHLKPFMNIFGKLMCFPEKYLPEYKERGTVNEPTD